MSWQNKRTTVQAIDVGAIRTLVRDDDAGGPTCDLTGLAWQIAQLRDLTPSSAHGRRIDELASAVAALTRDCDRAWARVRHLEAVIAAVRQEVGP
jgi:hypothetical protein